VEAVWRFNADEPKAEESVQNDHDQSAMQHIAPSGVVHRYRLGGIQMKKLMFALIAAGSLSACTATEQGAGVGAATGAVIGGVATGNVRGAAVGAAIGGVSGALIGNVAGQPGRCYYRDRYGNRYVDRC